MLSKRYFSISAVALGSIAVLLASGFARTSTQMQSEGASTKACDIQATTFDGWQAQQVTNRWLQLIFVSKLGGRLMQVTFAGHPFLFVNPKYRGQYFPPAEGTRKWFNYGGDKIWPMPEGSQDDQHWPGPISDALDDGDYAFRVVSQGAECVVRLEGPPDAATGLQYTREIGIDSDSPEISFHVTMKNVTDHAIRWSVQSVTQYDTADASNPRTFNNDFWAFTPANPKSAYFGSYHVRSGLAEDPSYSIRNNIFALRSYYSTGADVFTLHWLDLQSEVWIDSTAGWIAVIDGASRYAMIEEFDFDPSAEYPDKATVIFYKNGPAVNVDRNGVVAIRTSAEDTPFYMEAELNSPMVRLAPGESYTFKTRWFATRIGSDFKAATDAGVIGQPLSASTTNDGVTLSGTFGVFFAGKLVARFTSSDNKELAAISLQAVNPADTITLNQQVKAPVAAERVSLWLIDSRGVDRGSLGEARIGRESGGS